MTQALDAEGFCSKQPTVFDWTILIEHRSLDFAELNSSNRPSPAWFLLQGKPVIYQHIEHLIACGFKKFLLTLHQVDAVVKQQIQRISQNVASGFTHGDLCFSNILFEPASGIIRFIDPRGDFMGPVNQGDPRYDLAKILHSVHGRYDFIINDLFVLMQEQADFCFHMPQSDYLKQLEQLLFDSIQTHTCYVLNDLILLESLLFLTMLPLHHDQPKRQIARCRPLDH